MPQPENRGVRGTHRDQLEDVPRELGEYDDIDAGAPYSKTQFERTHEAGAGQHRDAAFYHEAAAHHHRQAADFHEQDDHDEAQRHAELAQTHSHTAHEHTQAAHGSTRPKKANQDRRSSHEAESVRGPSADLTKKQSQTGGRTGKPNGQRRKGSNGRRS